MAFCVSCGEPNAATFCRACGAKQPVAVDVQTPDRTWQPEAKRAPTTQAPAKLAVGLVLAFVGLSLIAVAFIVYLLLNWVSAAIVLATAVAFLAVGVTLAVRGGKRADS